MRRTIIEMRYKLCVRKQCNHDITNIRGSKYIYYLTSLSCYGPVRHVQKYHFGANNGSLEDSTEGRNMYLTLKK